MKRRKYLRVAMAAMAMWVMLVPSPGDAHVQYTWASREGLIGGETGFCVYGDVDQWHDRHQVSTYATNCTYVRDAWHTQYQEYYKVAHGSTWGEFCFSEGWYQSPYRQRTYTRYYNYDIWHWCNNGGGVWVHLTIDSWQYSWKSDWEGWRGGVWRPATEHCHCP